jgi:hypothetical protein
VLSSLVDPPVVDSSLVSDRRKPEREIDFRILENTDQSRVAPCLTQPFLPQLEGFSLTTGRNPVSTAGLPTIIAELHLAGSRPGAELSETRRFPGLLGR